MCVAAGAFLGETIICLKNLRASHVRCRRRLFWGENTCLLSRTEVAAPLAATGSASGAKRDARRRRARSKSNRVYREIPPRTLTPTSQPAAMPPRKVSQQVLATFPHHLPTSQQPSCRTLKLIPLTRRDAVCASFLLACLPHVYTKIHTCTT